MSDTNQAVQPQKIVRILEFQILKVDASYYLWSENKGADQLCSFAYADCWFSDAASQCFGFYINIYLTLLLKKNLHLRRLKFT